MKVSIVPGCVGCGLCVSLCPQVFQFGPLETAQVVQQPSCRTRKEVRDAAAQCPVGVIRVEENPCAPDPRTPL